MGEGLLYLQLVHDVSERLLTLSCAAVGTGCG